MLIQIVNNAPKDTYLKMANALLNKVFAQKNMEYTIAANAQKMEINHIARHAILVMKEAIVNVVQKAFT